VSEINDHSEVLCSYTDVNWPRHLSLLAEGDVLVADCFNHRILLLNSQLQLQGVIDDNSENSDRIDTWEPRRLCYNALTSEVYVLHNKEVSSMRSDHISVLILRSASDSAPQEVQYDDA